MGMAENVFAAPTDIDSSPKNEPGSTEQSLFKLLAPWRGFFTGKDMLLGLSGKRCY